MRFSLLPISWSRSVCAGHGAYPTPPGRLERVARGHRFRLRASGQIVVSESLAFHAAGDHRHAVRCREWPQVVPRRHLRRIATQVLARDKVVCAIDTAPKQRPDRLDRVRRHRPAHVLTELVAYSPVLITQHAEPLVGAGAVAVNRRAGCHSAFTTPVTASVVTRFTGTNAIRFVGSSTIPMIGAFPLEPPPRCWRLRMWRFRCKPPW